MYNQELYLKNYKRIILVDTENINASFMDSIHFIGEDDLCILAHSSNSFKIDFKYIPVIQNLKCNIIILNTINGTPNSMDFCICTELGYIIATVDAREFIIISDDTGYKPVVNMWRQRGYNVKLWGRPDILRYQSNCIIAQGEKAKNLVTQLAQKETEEKNNTDKKGKKQLDLEEKINNLEFKQSNVMPNIDSKEETDKLEDNSKVKEEQIENNKLEEILEWTNTEGNKLDIKGNEHTEKELKTIEENKIKQLELDGLVYNADILVKHVNIFGASKEKQICKVIYKHKKYKDAETRLAELIKRNREVYLFNIMSNWDKFKHVEN